MKNFLPFLFICSLLFLSQASHAQQKANNLLNLFHIKAKDLPSGYQFTEKLMCKSNQAKSLYKSVDSYQDDMGKVVYQSYQSVKAGKDSGTILYFQFQSKRDRDNFLRNHLWGNDGHATSAHPEEYALYLGTVLVIWSTNLDSKLKEVSQKHISRLR